MRGERENLIRISLSLSPSLRSKSIKQLFRNLRGNSQSKKLYIKTVNGGKKFIIKVSKQNNQMRSDVSGRFSLSFPNIHVALCVLFDFFCRLTKCSWHIIKLHSDSMKGGEKKVFGKQSNGEASEDFFNSIYRIFAGGTRQICWNSNLFFTFVSRLFVQQEGKVLLPTRESV